MKFFAADKPGRRRAAVALVATIVAAAVFQLSPSVPPRKPLPIAPLATAAPLRIADSLVQRVDTLRRGETVVELLERGGLSQPETRNLLSAAEGLDARRLPAGMGVILRSPAGDSMPSEIVFNLSQDRTLYLKRTSQGWVADEKRIAWQLDTVVVSGTIRSSLYAAMDSAQGAWLTRPARSDLAWTLADVYEYRIDMSRELRAGDTFKVLFELSTAPGGLLRVGDVLAARFEFSGASVEAIRYEKSGGRAEFFDQNGKSLRMAFLRAPLAFRRISSVFGMRRHPVLGVRRAHKGTDYAAASGTPIRSVGEGTVIFTGRKGGYGNAVEVRHRNGYVTRYGHMRGFAKGVRRGSRVGIGQTIGYVGMTGLASGPHLHFEVLVNGAQRDPRRALASKTGLPIPVADRAKFDQLRAAYIAILDSDVKVVAVR
ncbi:MAG: M23 family metallopeptidase [Gemmatimonadota bacterium]|nr:M23 family metallopeptidase [Gemmatimonadota bacterium]